MLHLDHISRVLATPPELFNEDQMWKWSPASTPAVMKKEDMNIFFATCMNSIGKDAWEKTLKCPSGAMKSQSGSQSQGPLIGDDED